MSEKKLILILLIEENNLSNCFSSENWKCLNEESNVVIKCLIDKGYITLFEEIKAEYDGPIRICEKLLEISNKEEAGLKDFKFEKIIIAAHLGGKEIPDNLVIQYNINKRLNQNDLSKKVHFVYYSSRDNQNNDYIRENYPSYSYENLVGEATVEQCKIFIKILEDRADGKEIKHFKSIVPKILINDLIRAFLQVSIDCNGIIHLKNQNLDTSKYEKESFDSDLEDYLAEVHIKRTLDELERYSNEVHQKLEEKANGLKKCRTCEDFLSKFNEFTETALKIKQSL